MICIGIGLKIEDNTDADLIRDRAAKHDLLASKTLSQGRFQEGVKDFCQHFELNFLQLSAFDESGKKASSRTISDRLTTFHYNGEETEFLQFIREERNNLPEKFYLIFACDWNEGDPVRLQKINILDLNGYFANHNSWYLWIYNYSARSYFPKLEVPLVFEIANKG